MTARLLYATYPPHLLSTCVACGNSPQTQGPSQIIHKSGCPRSGWDIGDACTNDDTGEQETIYDSPHHNPERARALGWDLAGDGSPISPPFTNEGEQTHMSTHTEPQADIATTYALRIEATEAHRKALREGFHASKFDRTVTIHPTTAETKARRRRAASHTTDSRIEDA